MLLDLASHVGGDGEADTDVAATPGEECGVDTDQLAAQIDQRPARIAGVDGGIGLDEVLEAGATDTAATEGTDNTAGHRLTQTERVPDGDHEVADAQGVGIRQRDRLQVVRVDSDHGDVGGRVGTHHLGLVLAPVMERNQDGVGTRDHVAVGENGAGIGIHDDAGAQALALAFALGDIEETAEKGIVEQRAGRLHHPRAGGDIHHTGDGALEHRRQRGQGLAIHRSRELGGGRRGLKHGHGQDQQGNQPTHGRASS